MANYFNLKNDQILNPPANTSLGSNTGSYSNVYIENTLVLGNVAVTEASIGAPKVSSIDYPDNDTAANPAGGQTITLNGSGFLTGASVLIDGVAVSVVSVVSSTQITFTSPIKSAGSYILYVINTDGSTAISIPGIQYSGTPTWTTPAGTLGTVYETANVNSTLVATGDAPITYALQSGTLPPGSTLTSNGILSGTTQATASSTTYTFTIRATDNELQDTDRIFSLTISPDVVTWVNPTQGATVEVIADLPISNIVLSATSAVGANVSYTANALPTGLSLSGNTISGTPTVAGNTSTSLTATASTTRSTNNVINWVVSLAIDPQFKYVTTLLSPEISTLPFNDDASTNNLPITVIGDTKPSNFGPYTPGYYSNYFDGSTSYLTAPVTASSGDLTIECWIYPTAATSPRGFIVTSGGNDTTAWGLSYNTDGAIGLWLGSFGGAYPNSTRTIPLNTWGHVAIVKTSGTVYLYVNGERVSPSVTQAGVFGSSTTAYIGTYNAGAGTQSFAGYISNFRYVSGTALYTSATFTPPTQPLTAITNTSLLTCQSNRFIDVSTNNVTITRFGATRIDGFDPFVPATEFAGRGSTYLDGSGDYLTVPSNAALNLGSGDFTIEMWAYRTSNGSFTLFQKTNSYELKTDTDRWVFQVNNSSNIFVTSGTLSTNVWVHVALVRNGATTTLYLNGVSYTSGSSVNMNSTADSLRIGSGAETFGGYISNFRIVKGTAVYTTNFTPPTSPLTVVTGTSLLTLQNNQPVNNNTFLDSSTNNFLVTRNGNTTQGAFSPYGGTWSNYFDGTGDVLKPPANAAFAFGTGAFCIEAWIYNTTLKNYSCLVTTRPDNGNYADAYHIGWDSTGGVSIYVNTTPRAGGPSGSIKSNIWQHFVCCRNASGVVSLFVDGVRVGTETVTTNFTRDLLGIGDFPTTQAEGIIGYISNLRLVKGNSVYDPTQTTLTVPTEPLQLLAGTSLLTCTDNRFVDDSVNNFAITRTGDVRVEKFNPFGIRTAIVPQTYSAYFDGVGDSLSGTSWSSAGVFGTGNFTVECWVYATGAPQSNQIIWGCNSYPNTTGLYLSYYGGSGNNLGVRAGATTLIDSSAGWALNTWLHVAVVRSGSTLTLYINGTTRGSTTFTNNCTDGLQYIGRPSDTTNYAMQGYISNFRIVKGTAVYTSNFTPSTTPLTAVANTSLLTCQSDRFVDNSTNNFTITAVGNATPSQINPFGYTAGTRTSYTPSVYGGSMRFDGTGDNLATQSVVVLTPSANFTAECWVYNLGFSGSQYGRGIFTLIESGTNDRILVRLNAGFNAINLYGAVGGNPTFGTSGTDSSLLVTPSSWTHVALVRQGSSFVVYLNGVVAITATSAANFGNLRRVLVATNTDGTVTDFNGSISDFRFVNGTALYTSNFVPPAAPLSPVANTALMLTGTGAAIYDSSTGNNLETVGDAKVSTSVIKYGNTSLSFDGSGDWLQFPSSQTIAFGTGDFTVECWVNFASNNGTYNPFVRYDGSGTFDFGYDYLTAQLKYNGSAGILVVSQSFVVGTWYHVALTRTSGSSRLFVNGTQVGSTATGDTNNYAVGAFKIGGSSFSGSHVMNGYISDLRITRGIARYTANFTPPTSTLLTK